MDDGSRDERRVPSAPGRVIGKVIKSDSADVLSAGERGNSGVAVKRAGVVNAEEFEARAQAKHIITEAQQRAEEIKADALRFKEEVFSKARDEAKAEVQARATEELARAKMQAGQMLADSEKSALDLALKIAAKIIGRDLERDPEALLDIVANCTEAARSARALVLKVHPDDAKLLRDKRPKLMELIGRAVDLTIRDDSDVSPGGCIIQTEFGTIDGQIRTQFEMLRNVLMPNDGKKEAK